MSGREVRSADKENDDKVFFAVLDVTDGRRYKVFVRHDSIPKLKLGKVRKTLCSASGKPSSSFQLWLGDELLESREDDNCAALGITQKTVLLMRPSRAEATAAMTPKSPADGIIEEGKSTSTAAGGTLGGASDGGISSSRHPCVVKQLLSDTSDTSPVVELNERQRALQVQLYEEAKRCQLFSSAEIDGNSNGDGGGDDIPQMFFALVDGVQGEHTNDNDESLAEPVKDTIGIKGETTKPPSPGVVMDGLQYYNMYSPNEEEEEEKRQKEVPRTENEYKHAERASVHHVAADDTHSGDWTRNTYGLSTTAATAPSVVTSNGSREMELVGLVEMLRDDVAELIALQIRNETTIRALQQELAVSQQHERNLQKREQHTRQQLDALLARFESLQNTDGEPVFSADVIRDSLRNMAAVHQYELLLQEKRALERRLVQEVRKNREMEFAFDEMKGNVRVLVRVRPPFRFLCEQDVILAHEATKFQAVGGIDAETTDEARMVVDTEHNTIGITDPNGVVRQFEFYRVLPESSTQLDVFSEVAPLVQLACKGVNVSVVAYGPSGSGKTYTIMGPGLQRGTTMKDDEVGTWGDTNYGEDEEKDDTEEMQQREGSNFDDGILPRAIRMLFQHLRTEALEEAALTPHGGDKEEGGEEEKNGSIFSCRLSSMFEVSCSLLELYNDKVQDLLAQPHVVVPSFHVGGSNKTAAGQQRGRTLNAPQLSVKTGQGGLMHAVGLTHHVVRDAQDALRVLRDGASRRQVHATQQNSSSSRSHLIFTIYLSQRRRICDQGVDGRTSIASKRLESKLVFVDLAGSDRVAKSQSVGDRLVEARHISKSLAALGDVVAALSNTAAGASGVAYVPYRNGVLPALLQDVIGNRSKTVLIACVSPSDPPYENHTAETATTLQFASRVRCVRNFSPGFPATTKGTSAPAKGSSVHGSETDAGSSRFVPRPLPSPSMDGAPQPTTGRSGKKLWMRPTKSSKQRVGVASRTQNTTAALSKEAERVDDVCQTAAPVLHKMRF